MTNYFLLIFLILLNGLEDITFKTLVKPYVFSHILSSPSCPCPLSMLISALFIKFTAQPYVKLSEESKFAQKMAVRCEITLEICFHKRCPYNIIITVISSLHIKHTVHICAVLSPESIFGLSCVTPDKGEQKTPYNCNVQLRRGNL